MRTLRHILGGVLLLLAAVGCSGVSRKIGPVEVQSVERLGTSGVEISLLVPNHSGRNLKVRKAELCFRYNDAPLARAELRGEALIRKQAENHLATRWKITSNDPAALLFLQKRLAEQNHENLSLDYRVQVQIGGVGKTFSAERAALSEILCNFVPTK